MKVALYWQNELRKANQRIADLEAERLALLAYQDKLEDEIERLTQDPRTAGPGPTGEHT